MSVERVRGIVCAFAKFAAVWYNEVSIISTVVMLYYTINISGNANEY